LDLAEVGAQPAAEKAAGAQMKARGIANIWGGQSLPGQSRALRRRPCGRSHGAVRFFIIC